MRHHILAVLLVAMTFSAAGTQTGRAETSQTGTAQPAEKVTSKPIAIYSQGVRLAGDIWTPPGATVDQKRPAILMMHGFGGKKDELNRLYASKFAAQGYYVLTFDYRGFGESDGDLLPTGEMPKGRDKEFEVKVREVRNVVNAINQYQDIEAALSYLKGEPGVDADMLAVWGTSLGGGLALKTAVAYPEIKVLIAQVAAFDMMPFYTGNPKTSPAHPDNIDTWRTAIARGAAPFLPGEKLYIKFSEHHQGYAHSVVNFFHEPLKNVEKLRAATLIIDVENEELFDVKQQGVLLFDRIKDRTKARYEMLPAVSHFKVYENPETVAAVLALQVAWLKEHLPVK
ncbi:MAG: alpha/beta hydrolase [Hyphomicrobiaceae bacterium]